MAEPIPFLPPLFPPEISSFRGTSIAITPSGTEKILPTPAGRKYSTGLSPLTSSPSIILTHPPFHIALLTFSLLPPFLPSFAPGRCYRTWVLTTNQFFYLTLFRPNERPPFFNFQKARWDNFDSQCPSAEEYSFLLCCCSTSLALNAAKSSIPFCRIKRPLKAWWPAEVEGAVRERRKAYAAAHRSDENRLAYISASQRAWPVIGTADNLLFSFT